MSPRTTLAVGALQAGLAVVLGAFAAHALKDSLVQRDQLANWQTAVRYQMWHALATCLVAVLREKRAGLAFASWAFPLGSLLFSGSLYCLAFDVLRPVMGPITPIGGAFLIASWVSVAVWAWRGER